MYIYTYKCLCTYKLYGILFSCVPPSPLRLVQILSSAQECFFTPPPAPMSPPLSIFPLSDLHSSIVPHNVEWPWTRRVFMFPERLPGSFPLASFFTG